MTTDASILGYRAFLVGRDGEPDPYRSTLSGREGFFRWIEANPVRSKQVIDRETFLRNVVRDRPEPGLDPRMLWLLATARSNQAERFGVELGRLYGVAAQEDDDPERIHIVLQESYHTRVLADVVGIFGLPVPQHPPPRPTRMLIHMMVFNPFPERFALPLVGFSEMMGCVLFRLLRDRGLELFADEPEVAERIRVLFDEILADEICHVGFVEARLGRFGKALMRGLFRRAAPRMPGILAPEVVDALGRDRIAEAFAAPFSQRSLAREFPERAYAF